MPNREDIHIPYITITTAAIAATKGIAARREGAPKVRLLQEYHGRIRQYAGEGEYRV